MPEERYFIVHRDDLGTYGTYDGSTKAEVLEILQSGSFEIGELLNDEVIILKGHTIGIDVNPVVILQEAD